MRRLLVMAGLATTVACIDATGPAGGLRLAIVPIVSHPAFQLQSGDLNEVVVQVTRLPTPPGGVVADDTAAVDTAGQASPTVVVPLLSANEQFAILVEGVRSSDGVVLYSGTDTVTVTGDGTTTIATVNINYVGPCHPGSGCTLALAPQDTVVAPGATFLIRASVDSVNVAKPGVPIELMNLSPALINVTAGRLLTALPATTGGLARVAAAIEGGAVDTLQVTVSGIGAPAKLAFLELPSTALAGAVITPAVQVAVEDSLGNVVRNSSPNITVAIGTNPGSVTAPLLGTTTVAAVAGVATFSTLSLNAAGTGYTLTASAPGLATATSGPFNVGTGVATKLAFLVQPTAAVAGAAITSVEVAIEDALGNTVTSATTSIAVATGTTPAGILSGTTTVAAVNGVATFSTLTLNLAATGYTLTASAPGLTSATSNAFAISAGAAARLVLVTQPGAAVAGIAITPAVQVAVEDAFGNPVTNATTSITVAIGTIPAGILSGTTTVAAVNGVATFSTLTLNLAATGYTLTASAPGLTSATSSAFSVSAGVASQLVFLVQPDTVLAGLAITPALQVAVEDAEGNLVTSATTSITIAIGSSPLGGLLSGTETVAAVSGVATFANLILDLAGNYTLIASATGLTSATSALFTIP